MDGLPSVTKSVVLCMTILSLFLVGMAASRINHWGGAFYVNLGYIELTKGLLHDKEHHRSAESFFIEAHTLDEDNRQAKIGLARVYFVTERFPGTISVLSAQNHAGFWVPFLRQLLAEAYHATGQEEKAVTEWKRMSPEHAKHFNRLAKTYERRGDYSIAEYYYKVATTIDPSSPDGYYNLAFLYWRSMGDDDGAVWAIHKALEYDEGESDCRYGADPQKLDSVVL